MNFRLPAIVALMVVAHLPGMAQVFVDQVGYRRTSPKYVFATGEADSFAVVDAASNLTILRGQLSPWKLNDPATGLTIRRGDFSAMMESGRYRVRTSAGATSADFDVADTVYRALARSAQKAFYFQRCGVSLPFAHAGWYLHGYCHTADATFHATAESTGTLVATGGWHDAGDYGKYVVNAGITVGTLLLAYDLDPVGFGADDVGIPESGNGVPDLLDEVRFELEWLLRMQGSQGGVFTKLTKTSFEAFVMPQSDPGPRFIYQVSSAATADVAAVMARASRTFQSFDPLFAATCLQSAERAWSFLTSHPAIVPAGGFVNPTGTSTGEYGDSDDRDERLWAAAELFAATGSSEYDLFYGLNMSARGLFSSGLSWQFVNNLAHITYLTAKDRTLDQGFVVDLTASLKTLADGLLARRTSSGLHMTLVQGEFVWGSNSSSLNHALLLLVASRVLGDGTYRTAAEDQLHYILGVNPLAQSYVTGFGTTRPMAPHHRPSASDGVAEPIPGFLVGGPNQFGGDPVLNTTFTNADPPAWWYVDAEGSYASNEVAINWNAPLVLVAGMLSSDAGSTGSIESPDPVPSDFGIDPVYPNPFNPRTRIRFRLARAGRVSLDVVDMAGRAVERLVEGDLSAGEHDKSWDADHHASGVYLMRLISGENIATQKAILIR